MLADLVDERKGPTKTRSRGLMEGENGLVTRFYGGGDSTLPEKVVPPKVEPQKRETDEGWRETQPSPTQ